ncbi:type II secretion protein F [bacteria symbiont BFo1 of Frankliniella occidentalis]|uniref:type II secretion system inner membrane protein GspF n=1 Tax=Erwinia aphidicola TaxID=68334 RepID=UPI0006646BA9|nr:type II secretion system inner membrane protein GspF [Erwinia aphidicola]KMV72202.1 type II secretion protein F [bacteria symbiont BFo1 of Frankliniella occidentalis]PIJ58836.1 type II secretion system protein GspF [Erwinia sp. OLMDLW33]KYP86272.1 type II secretion protein F [bacteria symbiont BFo1 of Frankliniella occidentalis]KYP91873.1 type II secretion protein F [bacteria symbiont BFo1 of Frankliniella occidentalis]MBD1374995.1 type II secretion system inner membrane protein GspF [Erwin
MRFRYQAVNRQGQRVRGVLEADTAQLARQRLREQQLQPLQLRVQRAGLSLQRSALSAGERVLLIRQLATLVAAALPLEQALLALENQTTRPAGRAMLHTLRQKVLEGATLAYAVALYPAIFPPLYQAMIAAGEASGKLDSVLEQLADYSEKSAQLKSKLTQALIYPLLLTLVAIGVISVLLAAVVPTVVEQFVHMKQALPLSTRLLMALSDLVRRTGFPLLVLLLLAAGAAHLLLRQPRHRLRWHQATLRLPIVGRIVLNLNLARYARTLSILSNSAVPLLEGMSIGATVLTNQFIRQQLEQAATQVREGSSLTLALEQTQLLSPMMRHMVASGESSGELDSMLARCADMQDSAFLSQMTLAVSLFEPLLVVVMAAVVLFIVLAILQPILQLNNLVG